MADVKVAYGTQGQLLTCTLASLASSLTAGRESTAVVNSATDKWLDALVMVQIKLIAGTIANDKGVHVFVYGTVDDGTTYGDAVTGTDAAVTLTDPTQLSSLGFIQTPTQSLTYKGGPWSVAGCFGGVLPARWGIVVRNYSGIALSAVEGDHKKTYQGIYRTVV